MSAPLHQPTQAARLRHARRIARQGAFLGLVLISGTAAAQDAPRSRLNDYDIPSQRLASALARFGEASGVDVLLDEPRAAGRQSSAVIGSYSPPQALTIMLGGTGLIARFTGPNSAVIVFIERATAPLLSTPGATAGATIALDMMRVVAPRIIGTPSQSSDPAFIMALAGQIRRLVIDGDALTPGVEARMRIRTRIRADGTLHDIEILSSNGDRARDRRITALLEGAHVDLSPPPSLRQPLRFDVSAK